MWTIMHVSKILTDLYLWMTNKMIKKNILTCRQTCQEEKTDFPTINKHFLCTHHNNDERINMSSVYPICVHVFVNLCVCRIATCTSKVKATVRVHFWHFCVGPITGILKKFGTNEHLPHVSGGIAVLWTHS